MNTMSLKLKEFFLRGILPELIGRWFSRPTPTPQRTMGPGNSVDTREEKEAAVIGHL